MPKLRQPWLLTLPCAMPRVPLYDISKHPTD